MVDMKRVREALAGALVSVAHGFAGTQVWHRDAGQEDWRAAWERLASVFQGGLDGRASAAHLPWQAGHPGGQSRSIPPLRVRLARSSGALLIRGADALQVYRKQNLLDTQAAIPDIDPLKLAPALRIPKYHGPRPTNEAGDPNIGVLFQIQRQDTVVCKQQQFTEREFGILKRVGSSVRR